MSDASKAVFVSYASQDAEAARGLGAALAAAGIEVWLDQSELRGGDAWDQAIRRQIRDCALFVALISESTRARPEGYFRLEWKLAVDRSHLMAAERAFLLPVVLDGTPDDAALVPDRFREVQWTRLPPGADPAAFVAQVARLLRSDYRAAPAAAAPATAAPAPRPPRRRRWLAAAAVVAVALCIGAYLAVKFAARDADVGLVAVLPFENTTGDASIDYLSDGISESLINRLSNVAGLRVISRSSAFAFKGQKLAALDIGRKLGVDALVVGTLVQRGANIAISAELVRVRDATELWGERYARRADDLLEVEGEIAGTIARNLRRHLTGEEQARLTRAATSNPEAYRLYLKGRDYLVGNQQEMDKGIDFFQQAIARAPDFALAHAGLAEAYATQAYLRGASRAEFSAKAHAAVARALELDPNLAEAHSALAVIRSGFEWDWAGADAEFRRALELNPGSLASHDDYGSFLMSMRRFDEGRAHSAEAARLDPLSVMPIHDLAINDLVRHRFDEAAAGFRKTIDLDPNWTWGYIKLARTLAAQKKCKEALAQADVGERRIAGGAAPLSRSWLGAVYANCGQTARAQQKLDELHALAAKQYVDPVTFATVLGALGRIDEALDWYEKAYADRTPNMVVAAILPALSTELVGNARYQAIVDRMGFPATVTR